MNELIYKAEFIYMEKKKQKQMHGYQRVWWGGLGVWN